MDSCAKPSGYPKFMIFHEFMHDTMDFGPFFMGEILFKIMSEDQQNIMKNIVKNMVISWKFLKRILNGIIGINRCCVRTRRV